MDAEVGDRARAASPALHMRKETQGSRPRSGPEADAGDEPGLHRPPWAPHKMRYVLGVDGGGTKCDAVLMDETGTVCGWGRGGSTHGLYVGRDVAAQSVRDAVQSAVTGRSVEVSRICGAGPFAALGDILNQELCSEMFVQGGETGLGFATALTTHGILILSGTGSFVFGLTEDGRHLHEGGNGPIVADEGSAYHIGILGMRAMFRSHYCEARRTSLAQAVPKAMGVETQHEAFHQLYIDRIGRSQVAAVAKTVNDEAEKGDAVAIAVLQRAADELGELLVEVIRELRMQQSEDYLVATGSVAQGSRIFWQRLCEIAHSAAPGLRPIQPRVKPVIGACLLCLRDLGVQWSENLLDHIVATQGPFVA